mmetsp:Transcript_26381/g.42732  ORF Transcript_26381/g.42732 Transcript_26381/m.42732 type:complete len:291 (-) Transcript_26381:3076-3948(-)
MSGFIIPLSNIRSMKGNSLPYGLSASLGTDGEDLGVDGSLLPEVPENSFCFVAWPSLGCFKGWAMFCFESVSSGAVHFASSLLMPPSRVGGVVSCCSCVGFDKSFLVLSPLACVVTCLSCVGKGGFDENTSVKGKSSPFVGLFEGSTLETFCALGRDPSSNDSEDESALSTVELKLLVLASGDRGGSISFSEPKLFVRWTDLECDIDFAEEANGESGSMIVCVVTVLGFGDGHAPPSEFTRLLLVVVLGTVQTLLLLVSGSASLRGVSEDWLLTSEVPMAEPAGGYIDDV